ncbi:MAG: MATE family efflux transporter [Candidatus Thermoplasmatota archaeon]|nr:MATE family efflux transporter [Candidatus Thermoplasmatota archaeon]MBS3790505.1 MATE family efflux transporter [Candidatus Thermoplasmatota archaeon]
MRGSKEERREKILNGKIIPTLLSLAWPVVLGSMLQTAYNLADTFWLGRVSTEAVAAPITAFPLVMVLNALGMGLATAGISLVSQHTGSGGDERANEAAGQVFGLLFVISAVGAVIGLLVSGPVMKVIADPDVYPLALTYVRIIFAGAPLMFTFIAFRFILRGTGDMKTPMYIRGVGVVLNVILDPLLILGIGPFPQMGVAGAAIATVSTRGVAAVIGGYMLFTGKVDIKLSLRDIKLRLRWVKKIFDIGLPASVARVGSSLGFVGLIAMISSFGTVAISSYGVGQRVIQMINLGIWGFAGSATTMVGQNVGAQQQSRAEQIVHKTLMVSGVIMVTIAIVIYLIREPMVAFFLDESEVEQFGAVVSEASRFISIFVISIPFFGWFRIFDSTYRGTGHTKAAMSFSLTRILVLRLGFSYFIAFPVFGIGLNLGIVGVWIGMTLSNITITGLSYLYFRTGRWKERTIEEKDEVEDISTG